MRGRCGTMRRVETSAHRWGKPIGPGTSVLQYAVPAVAVTASPPVCLLHREGHRQHGVLQEGRDLRAPGLAPVVLARLALGWRTRDPARCPRLVAEIFLAEDGLEHTFLVADDEGVLDGEEDDGHGDEPEHAGDHGEAHPDEEVPDVEWVPHPGKDSVRHEALHGARAAPRHGARGGHAAEPDRFTDGDEDEANEPVPQIRL